MRDDTVTPNDDNLSSALTQMFKGWITLYVMETLSSGCAYKTYCAIHCIDINTEQGIFKPVDREISGKFGELTCDDDQLTVQTESNYLIEEDLRTKNGIERQGESVTRTLEKKIKQTFDKAS